MVLVSAAYEIFTLRSWPYCICRSRVEVQARGYAVERWRTRCVIKDKLTISRDIDWYSVEQRHVVLGYCSRMRRLGRMRCQRVKLSAMMRETTAIPRGVQWVSAV